MEGTLEIFAILWCARQLNAVKGFYKERDACARVRSGTGKWFETDGEERQGYVMSTLKFNVFMDGVLRIMKVR